MRRFICAILCRAFLTFADARHFVAQHVDRVHAAVFLEHFAQLILVHGLGHLAHEHFDVVGIGLLAGESAQSLRRIAEVIVDGQAAVVVDIVAIAAAAAAAAGGAAAAAVAVIVDVGTVVTTNKAAIVAHVHATVKRWGIMGME